MLCLAVLLLACGSKENGGTSPKGTTGTSPTNTTGGSPRALDEHCVDRPGDLPRPPTRGLPCELIPPRE
nr:MAG: hypothetical protein DIU78_06740 [Pseudomonadota bacterium]